jgi:hypothetical protein
MHFSPNIIWEIKSRTRWAAHVAYMEGEEIIVGKPEGKRLVGSRRRRWDYNIKMNFQEVEWGRMDWIDLAQDRKRWLVVMNAVIKYLGCIKCGEYLV